MNDELVSKLLKLYLIMMTIKLLTINKRLYTSAFRPYTSTINRIENNNDHTSQFETVFAFPFVKYFAIFNRLKVYHIFGTSLAIPCSGILEMLDIFPTNTILATSYIGVTGGFLLSLASIPLHNVIGYLYISEDNKQIKISAVDFWGKRKDRIVSADDWIPLLDLPPKTLDALFLSPQLKDGTKYKLFVKFGNTLNARKIGQVLE